PWPVAGAVGGVRARRPASRGGWLADDRGVRRDRRKTDPGRRAQRSAERPARAVDRVPGRAHDPRGRTTPHARQRRPRSRRSRGGNAAVGRRRRRDTHTPWGRLTLEAGLRRRPTGISLTLL